MQPGKFQSVAVLVLVIIFLTVPKLYAEKTDKVFNMTKGGAGELKSNYRLELEINTESLNKKFSLMVSDREFSFSQFFPEVTVSFEGIIDLKNVNTFIVDYKLGFTEKVVMGDKTEKENIMWVESGCASKVILELDKNVSLFEANNRSYKLKFRKAE